MLKRMAIILCLSQFAAQAALVWEPAAHAQVVFAARPAVVRQDIRNDGAATASQSMRLHLQQLSSSIAAPVPGWELRKQVEVPARETLRTSVDVSLPKVTSPTRFRLTWNSETGKVLGHTEIVGCPENLFEPLRTVSVERPLGLMGKATALATFLRGQGCRVTELHSVADIKTFTGTVLLVAHDAREKEEAKEFGRLAVEHAKERGVRIVWLVEPDNLSLSPEPSVCVFTHGQGTLVVSTGMKAADLSQSPLDQLRLVWLVELAVASEENRLLLLGRLMNL